MQKSEIAKVREQMKQTHELYLARQISVEGFGDIYKPLEQRLAELQSELPRLEAEVDSMKVNNVSADEVLSEANHLYARWPQLPVEDKRKIVEGILEKAVIGPGDAIELTLSYLPTSEEMVHSQQRLITTSHPVRESPLQSADRVGERFLGEPSAERKLGASRLSGQNAVRNPLGLINEWIPSVLKSA